MHLVVNSGEIGTRAVALILSVLSFIVTAVGILHFSLSAHFVGLIHTMKHISIAIVKGAFSFKTAVFKITNVL